ncbi:MAG: hypothetical protein HY869_13350 [Chloroflexi bacterium]|nr:hypothetical protein [Chloroflexota bacterium]
MTNNMVPHLIQEYEQQKALFNIQPVIVQRFFEGQAQVIADALISKTSQVHFSLPDRVVTSRDGQNALVNIPEAQRQNTLGGFLQRDTRELLMRRLNELEKSASQEIAVSAGLLRFAAAMHLVNTMLPAGRMVTYRADGDEQIPSIPSGDDAPESAITQVSDAIVEDGSEGGRGEVQTPFVPAARKFFLPQWVAFDDQGKLLVGSVTEAEAHIRSMQQYVTILHRALSLAPYVTAIAEYQQKRYGILGQLVYQGRALANFNTREIIHRIKERVEKQSLNRGLSITLSYFDDQTLEMETSKLEIIPAGRILFVPAFVVRAAQGEQAKVAQDTRLNSSTRRHLLAQLKALETAFQS